MVHMGRVDLLCGKAIGFHTLIELIVDGTQTYGPCSVFLGTSPFVSVWREDPGLSTVALQTREEDTPGGGGTPGHQGKKVIGTKVSIPLRPKLFFH